MVFGSYAQAFRAPTMGEMYNDSKHFSIGRFYTNYWVPNPNLRPETNETQEYGFGLRFDDLMLLRLKGYLPVTCLEGDRHERIAATIRHNRARGRHQITAMSEIGRTHSAWRHRHWHVSAFTGIYNDLAAALVCM